MTDAQGNALQMKEKQEVTSSAEQTKSGLVFTPDVDILETENEIKLIADLPGVMSEGLTIDLKESTLTITGETAPVGNTKEEDVYIEYEIGKYYRQFTLPEMINQDEIDAELKDGVLNLILPKVEKTAPRKITVRT